METIRRISALVIALSLLLPQRSCVNGDQVDVHYPLSNADSLFAIAVIAAVYLLPLLVLLLRRFRLASLLVGIAAAGVGLYFVGYGSTVVATTLMAGWYTYSFGSLVYLGASLVQLKRVLLPDKPLQPSAGDNG